MTRRFLRPVAAAVGVLAIAAVGVALQPERGAPPAQPSGRQPEQQPERGGGPGGRQASVGGGMNGMNRALRQLSRQVDDATKKDENLRLINDMQRGCVSAKGAPLPEGVLKKAKDDAAKAKLTDEFRRELIKVMRLLLDIETDIADGKADAAKAKLADLAKIRDHGHEEMGVEEN
jgi:hypothetical protein